MTDRYLFRGKTKIGERWVIGDLLQWGDGDMQIVVNDEDGEKSKYTVIPETVGQCTGLKDKNGKLIYEGDIYESYCDYDDTLGYSNTAEYYGVIAWNPNNYCWNIKTNNGLIPFNYCDWDISMLLGNQYDNPGLLEVKE